MRRAIIIIVTTIHVVRLLYYVGKHFKPILQCFDVLVRLQERHPPIKSAAPVTLEKNCPVKQKSKIADLTNYWSTIAEHAAI